MVFSAFGAFCFGFASIPIGWYATLTNSDTDDTSDTDDKRQRHGMYAKHFDELLERKLSNSVNYDRSILTLSSGGLGLGMLLSIKLSTSIIPPVAFPATRLFSDSRSWAA